MATRDRSRLSVVSDTDGEKPPVGVTPRFGRMPIPNPPRERKTFVLCFDGTGNKFNGTDEDSNILKIFRLLDKSDDRQLHYYQPGIGTYITSTSFTHTGFVTRMNSWYQKAKDSAVGSSFDQHVMGGYKFLMRFYAPGDDMYFFGFSRGAYTARFLAEMLDYVGLLSPGSEELARFAWKTFARWQQRRGEDEEDEEGKLKLYEFMKAFRETFSRPVRRIRFLGLFDTVNSVPRFEAAWMQRSKYPYTARSSAKVIRHAVGIDERRAKFRQDLVSGHSHNPTHHHFRDWVNPVRNARYVGGFPVRDRQRTVDDGPGSRVRRRSASSRRARQGSRGPSEQLPDDEVMSRPYRPRSRSPGSRSLSVDPISMPDQASQVSIADAEKLAYDSDDESPTETSQDIEEVWFPGGHADIGGGWPISAEERYPLSHVPLVWMVREAQKAGLHFDEGKLRELGCYDDRAEVEPTAQSITGNGQGFPSVLVTASSPTTEEPKVRPFPPPQPGPQPQPPPHTTSTFVEALELAATKGRSHDCLRFKNGLSMTEVITWNIMEFLPFRRMDLRSDGSWKPIRWPLPRGEVRDIPDGAHIHNSALKRMEANPKYRPGNLIIGGGGRGVRVAPMAYGCGRWRVLRDRGDPVGEVFVRDNFGKTMRVSEKE